MSDIGTGEMNEAIQGNEEINYFNQTAMLVGFTLAVGAAGLKLYQVGPMHPPISVPLGHVTNRTM